MEIAKNKKYMGLSFLLLALCILLTGNFVFSNYQIPGGIFIYYASWGLSGINLFLSSSIPFKILKGAVITLQFLCVYIVAYLFLRGWTSLDFSQVVMWVLVCLIIVRAIESFIQSEKGIKIAAWIPVSISVCCVAGIHYLMFFHMNSYNGLYILPLLILLAVTGSSGLYFATKLDPGKIKWLLLIANYLFATYFNIVVLFMQW